MKKYRLITAILCIIAASLFLFAGCGKTQSVQTDDPAEQVQEEKQTATNVSAKYPKKFKAAAEELCAEMNISIGEPYHTVEYDDHTVIFSAGKNSDDIPVIVVASYCLDIDNSSRYYAGAYEICQIDDTSYYTADIPALFWGYPDYEYGSRWMIGSQEDLEQVMSDEATFKHKINSDTWLYVNDNEEEGIAADLYNELDGQYLEE